MFTTLDKKKQIGWTISILIPLIIAFIPVSENFTVSLKLFFMITLFMIMIIAFELFPQFFCRPYIWSAGLSRHQQPLVRGPIRRSGWFWAG